ncbi:MAG: ribosome-associated protein IOJAP, partial [Rhodobacterales bacterium CG18_big_fil_WC_8_21_14_2_50_71_9]
MMAAQATDESGATLALVLASLDDDKAEDVVSFDLRGKSPMADH